MLDKDIREGKIIALVGYWGFLCILPLLLKKENEFAVYHAKQGLVMFIFLAAGFLFNIFGWPINIVWKADLFIYTLVFIWGTLSVLRGKYAKIFLVTQMAKKINL